MPNSLKFPEAPQHLSPLSPLAASGPTDTSRGAQQRSKLKVPSKQRLPAPPGSFRGWDSLGLALSGSACASLGLQTARVESNVNIRRAFHWGGGGGSGAALKSFAVGEIWGGS